MNTLYPIFLKTENFRILIVGGGFVGTEKVRFLLKNSPDAKVTLVAKEISEEIRENAARYAALVLREKAFEDRDLEGMQLVIAGTADKELNREIYEAAKHRGILVNVADTPELCDFYLGSIVTKGDLKLAISTNGKSPTLSKRLREFFEDVLPDEIDELAHRLQEYRHTLKGELQERIEKLNALTKSILGK